MCCVVRQVKHLVYYRKLKYGNPRGKGVNFSSLCACHSDFFSTHIFHRKVTNANRMSKPKVSQTVNGKKRKTILTAMGVSSVSASCNRIKSIWRNEQFFKLYSAKVKFENMYKLHARNAEWVCYSPAINFVTNLNLSCKGTVVCGEVRFLLLQVCSRL